MKLRMIAACALALSAAGAAHAQDHTNALDNKMLMGHFYTDSSMTAMKDEAAFKTELSAMSAEDRAMMKKECETGGSSHQDFCNMMVKAMGDQ